MRCKAKVAAKQDRWVGLRFLDFERSALQALRAEIAKLAARATNRAVRMLVEPPARGVRVGGVTVAPGEAREVAIALAPRRRRASRAGGSSGTGRRAREPRRRFLPGSSSD
jgi:hypothetical protein